MKSIVVRALIVLGALAVVGGVNLAVAGKERVRRDGAIVYLPLAPVDPRSLVQGDYMALRFALAREIEARDAAGGRVERDGESAVAALTLDDRRVGTLAPATAGTTVPLRYRIRAGRVWLGTDAFFFEEGQAARFRGARYGELRVDPATGEAVLVGLRDARLQPL